MGVVVGGCDHFFQGEGHALHGLGEAVLDFAKGRKQAGAVGFEAGAFLDETELNGVPVETLDLHEFFGRGFEGGGADHSGEVDKIFVGEHGHVADDFVNDVGLGGVVGAAGVADVLGAEHEFLVEQTEENARVDEAFHRAHAEPVEAFEFAIEHGELRNRVSGNGQEVFGQKVFTAREVAVEREQFFGHGAPGAVFFVGVNDGWHGAAVSKVVAGDERNFVAARAVHWVVGTGVVEGEERDVGDGIVHMGRLKNSPGNRRLGFLRKRNCVNTQTSPHMSGNNRKRGFGNV